MHVITVAARKGGVAKTTTAVNLAAGLVWSGASVLLVDADSSGQAGDLVGVEWLPDRPVFASFLAGLPLAECVVVPDVSRPGLVLLPGDDQTLAAERGITAGTIPIQVRSLRAQAGALGVDYVVIDAPPRGAAQDLAVAAADLVVVPVAPSALSVAKAAETVDLVRAIGAAFPLPGRPAGQAARAVVLPVMVEGRTNDGRHWMVEVNGQFSGMLAPAGVPLRVVVLQAATAAIPLVWMAPDSDPAQAYFLLAGWVRRALPAAVVAAAAVEGVGL